MNIYGIIITPMDEAKGRFFPVAGGAAAARSAAAAIVGFGKADARSVVIMPGKAPGSGYVMGVNGLN